MAEVSRTHMTDTATYVLYRGDEVLDVGTASEIAKRRGVKADTIRFYCTASYQRKDQEQGQEAGCREGGGVMAETEGKMLTCDLCGATVFLKYVETKDYDGGFTHVRTFEKKPDGWQTWHVSNVISSTLCPSCNERMREALLGCISEIRGKADQDG